MPTKHTKRERNIKQMIIEKYQQQTRTHMIKRNDLYKTTKIKNTQRLTQNSRNEKEKTYCQTGNKNEKGTKIQEKERMETKS